MHIDSEMQDGYVRPQLGALNSSENGVLSCTMYQDWERLLKVTAENDGNTTKWRV